MLEPTQIGLPAGELERMLTLYDVKELATAVKPWLLRSLLDGGASAAVYLDPDIVVFDSLDGIGELAARARHRADAAHAGADARATAARPASTA